MHFLVTGHTGFKGAWLTLLLRQRGHQVSGLALDPVPRGLYDRAEVAAEVELDARADIRDAERVKAAVSESSPDVVIHMAAQALVRQSFKDPRSTVETNVIGTMNVLEAVRHTPSVRAQVVVTTDKVYRNAGDARPFREQDPLGGHDPYSASKAMTELLTQSWSTSFPARATATARAGNVIGGGDISTDRLLPDLLSALAHDRQPVIRYPDAVRPWQHVLDVAHGYLALVEAMLAERADEPAWNFGPSPDSFLTVGQMADRVCALWGDGASWRKDDAQHPPEARTLTLDAGLARAKLGWEPRLDIDEALEWTVGWTRDTDSGRHPAEVTREQAARFETLSTDRRA